MRKVKRNKPPQPPSHFYTLFTRIVYDTTVYPKRTVTINGPNGSKLNL